MRSRSPVSRVLAALADKRLLLAQDKTLPNVVGLVTGESLRASWWSHPEAQAIFFVLSELADHPDVLFVKLLRRKDTLVHRSLWPAVLAVGSARQRWQTEGLSNEARRLLESVRAGGGQFRAVGAPVRELQVRLLVTTREIHTEAGRHETALESWEAWSRRAGCRAMRSVSRARIALEEATLALGAALEALPWPAAPGASSRPRRRPS